MFVRTKFKLPKLPMFIILLNLSIGAFPARRLFTLTELSDVMVLVIQTVNSVHLSLHLFTGISSRKIHVPQNASQFDACAGWFINKRSRKDLGN